MQRPSHSWRAAQVLKNPTANPSANLRRCFSLTILRRADVAPADRLLWYYAEMYRLTRDYSYSRPIFRRKAANFGLFDERFKGEARIAKGIVNGGRNICFVHIVDINRHLGWCHVISPDRCLVNFSTRRL